MIDDQVRICGVLDHLGDVSCAWPMLDVTVYAVGKLGGVELATAANDACKAWNEVCGIRLSVSTNPRTAHIIVGQRVIDGQNGILAQSELPCGFTLERMRQLQQEYDTSEVWTISSNPPAGKIDLSRVMAHELGHALGCGHINDGNLMAPVYSRAIALPKDGDVKEMRARYGLPAPVTPTPAIPPTLPPPASPTGKPRLVLPDGAVWELEGRRIQ